MFLSSGLHRNEPSARCVVYEAIEWPSQGGCAAAFHHGCLPISILQQAGVPKGPRLTAPTPIALVQADQALANRYQTNTKPIPKRYTRNGAHCSHAEYWQHVAMLKTTFRGVTACGSPSMVAMASRAIAFSCSSAPLLAFLGTHSTKGSCTRVSSILSSVSLCVLNTYRRLKLRWGAIKTPVTLQAL